MKRISLLCIFISMAAKSRAEAPPPASTTYLIGISSLIAAFLALIIVVRLYLVQKKKARREYQERQKLELEVRLLSAQHNPHFVSRSLQSIQELINTGRIHESNEYISLLRDTLKVNNGKEALQHEIDYLNAYLRIEQLRFNFKYRVYVDPSLRARDVSFPALLLQPLVENAVKHGVAQAEEGKIDLSFKREKSDLIVTIRDNGKGFVSDTHHEGYGLRLTGQRIELLNQAVAEPRVIMDVRTNQTDDTSIRLTFKAWL